MLLMKGGWNIDRGSLGCNWVILNGKLLSDFWLKNSVTHFITRNHKRLRDWEQGGKQIFFLNRGNSPEWGRSDSGMHWVGHKQRR